MRDRVTAALRKTASTFGSFTPGQKAVTLFATVALAVGGYFFTTWASTPTYAPLFSNLAPTDASTIVDKLQADGTPYKLTGGGQTIEVPQASVYDVRIKLSGQGLPAASDAAGYALLDKQGVMTSDFMQKVDYQRALEGELAKTIKAINGVQAATVHLAIPAKDVFADEAQKPTASVLVATAPTAKLSQNQVNSIVHLVAASVEGLTTDAVTVVGADGKVLSGDTAGTDADGHTQQTQAFEQRLSGSVQQMLDQVVGVGHAAVQLTADLDYDQTQTETKRYVSDPANPPLAETKKTESYSGPGTGATGVLGPDNIQVPAGAAAGNGGYQSSTETKNNAVGMVTETRKSAPGSVRKLSVAVLLDSKVAAGVNEAQIQQLVASAVGLDTSRGDTIAVSVLPFDGSAAKATRDELAAAQKAEKRAQLLALIKQGSVAGVLLLLIVAAALTGRRRNKKMRQTLQSEMTRASISTAAMGSPEAASPELISSEPVPAIEAPPVDDAGRLADRRREARQQEIAGLVEKQPQEIAQLLRGWLADRRG